MKSNNVTNDWFPFKILFDKRVVLSCYNYTRGVTFGIFVILKVISFGESLPLSVRQKAKFFCLFVYYWRSMELYEVTVDYVKYLRKFEPKKFYQMQMIKIKESF